jgi:hypothetical protein
MIERPESGVEKGEFVHMIWHPGAHIQIPVLPRVIYKIFGKLFNLLKPEFFSLKPEESY